MEARADLHVHSKYSDRPSEWFLRRVGAPESYTEPVEVYCRCREAGMQFVTISDHNRIDGALEIAHLPGTFLSSELTTYFPEDGCKIHLLVTGVSEAEFAELERLRENIYELRDYCLARGIVHSVAHPLFSVNGRLAVSHFEKLLLLFKRFEGINGARHPRACRLARAIFESLTPELIGQMAERHGIEPLGPEPWIKWLTGGSDDHGGQYIASAFTTTPAAPTLAAFLDHLRAGTHAAGGGHGTSLQLAHSFYHIAWRYYRSRFVDGAESGSLLMPHLFERLLEPRPAPPPAGVGQRVRHYLGRLAWHRRRRRMNAFERMLLDEFRNLAAPASPHQPVDDRRTFQVASRISHQLGYDFTCKLLEHGRRGRIVESLQAVASLGPVALGVAPYIAAMKTQHKDAALLEQVAARFPEARARAPRESGRRAWATDTYGAVNGVATTIRALADRAARRGLPLEVISCEGGGGAPRSLVHDFEPVGTFEIPEYEGLEVAFPPFLEMMQHIERRGYDEVLISTPGPVGLTALAAANLLGLRKVGIYHTDFPRYVYRHTQDSNLEAITWRYMLWFYEQMDCVLVPSEAYRHQLLEAGLAADRMAILRRGVDVERFSPALRTPRFFGRQGLCGERFTFLYVGRISAEKNVDGLIAEFQALLDRGIDAQLAVVGDGPDGQALRARYAGPRIGFTGCLTGLTLAQAYASADVFVFPSTTDTFGNVVLEAMASGLPAIVSDRGGPAEIVTHESDGLVVDPDTPGAFAGAMHRLYTESATCRRLGARAEAEARAWTWDAVLDALWQRGQAASPPQAPDAPPPRAAAVGAGTG